MRPRKLPRAAVTAMTVVLPMTLAMAPLITPANGSARSSARNAPDRIEFRSVPSCLSSARTAWRIVVCEALMPSAMVLPMFLTLSLKPPTEVCASE
jgi:hypothetical protein